MANKESSSFAQLFIPSTRDDGGTFIRKILVIVCLITAIVCGIMIISEKAQDKHTEDMNHNLQQIANNSATGSFSAEKEVVEQIKQETPEIPNKLVDVVAKNSDCIGWVTCGDVIDYPVMMNLEDNSYYLYRDFDKNDTKDGSIFCDNHIQPITDAGNLVLYGHNLMSGNGFASLTNWYPQGAHGGTNYQDFYAHYKKYPTIDFQTIYGGESTYKIFAGIYINTETKDGYPYPYYRKRKFNNEQEFMDFVGNIMDRSTFYTDVDLEYGDEIITLSTCYYYPLSKSVDARFALFARRVRDGESPEVDTSKVIVNSSPLFFDTYANRISGPWKGRDWVLENVVDWTAKVKNFENYDIDSLDEFESEGPIEAD